MSSIIMKKYMNLIKDKKPYKLFSLVCVSVIPSRRMSTDLSSFGATLPPPETAEKQGMLLKSEWQTSFELSHKIAEYRKQSRNLSPYDAIAPPPNSGLCGGIEPMCITDELRPRLTKLCNLALEKYNADNQGANFEFHDLVKSTTQLVAGRIYYITFEAKDATHPSNDAPRTFQAKVWDKIHLRDAELVVMSCSMKLT